MLSPLMMMMIAFIITLMMVMARSCHSAGGSLARVREVLISSLTLDHSHVLRNNSTHHYGFKVLTKLFP